MCDEAEANYAGGIIRLTTQELIIKNATEKSVKVSNDKEMAQSERSSHSINQGGKI